MWLACALVVLVTVGFVLPCMLDITMTPDSEFTTCTKGTWLMIAGAFWVFGATAWLMVGRPRRLLALHRSNPYPPGGFGPAESLYRHPAARAAGGYAEPAGAIGFLTDPRPLGPDDDPEFLLELGRRIRDGRADGGTEVSLSGAAPPASRQRSQRGAAPGTAANRMCRAPATAASARPHRQPQPVLDRTGNRSQC